MTGRSLDALNRVPWAIKKRTDVCGKGRERNFLSSAHARLAASETPSAGYMACPHGGWEHSDRVTVQRSISRRKRRAVFKEENKTLFIKPKEIE